MTKPAGHPVSPIIGTVPGTRPARRRRKARDVVTLTIYDPRKLAALRAATALGATLSVSFTGYKLIVSASDAPPDA